MIAAEAKLSRDVAVDGVIFSALIAAFTPPGFILPAAIFFRAIC